VRSFSSTVLRWHSLRTPSFSWLDADVDLASIVSLTRRSRFSGATFRLRQWAWYDVSILPARLQAGGVVRQHNDSQKSHHFERDEQGE
jgi:hypothetical protein